MKQLIQIVIFSLLLTTTKFAFANKNNFQFQINEYATTRQGGQTIDVNVRYAMKNNVSYAKYPDYRIVRKRVMPYLEPTKEIPVNTYWEIIAAKIGDDLMSRYPFSGVSVQIIAYPNEQGAISEPGFHGPIYTVGDVLPLTQVVMPAFNVRNH